MPPKALLLSVSVSAALKGLCGAHQRFAGKELKAGNGIRPKPWGIVSAGSGENCWKDAGAEEEAQG